MTKRPLLLALAVLALVSAAFAIPGGLRPQSERWYGAGDVRAAFAAAHIRLEDGGPPRSDAFARTFFAPQLKAYVLVWPHSAHTNPRVLVRGLKVFRVTAHNVEVDLPTANQRRQEIVRDVLATLS